jgi:hypothetical protein
MGYGSEGIPALYLINKEGMIVYSNSEENLDALNNFLSQSIK